jgi:methionine sulfoxide reductase heme-binding subunit
MIAASAGVPVDWLVARAAGLVAFGLLTLSVWLGLAVSTGLFPPRRQKSLVGWHQTLVWSALGMLVLHGTTLLLDPTLNFGFLAVLVPGTAPWRPLAVSAGVVCGWLMLVLALSFRFRRRIGQKNWRLFHYAAFGAFFIGLGHALTAGTDMRGGMGLVAAALAAGPVLWLTFFRILSPRTAPRPSRPASPPSPPAPRRAAATPPVAV